MKHRGRILFFIALIVFCLLLPGCSSDKGNAIHIGVAEDTHGILMAKDLSRSDQLTVIHNLYRGLFEVQKHEVVPVIAKEGMYNSDATVLTISLNENYTWSDGSPVTAEEIKNSLLALEGSGGNYAYQTKYIDWKAEEPVKVNEEGQILIRLSRSYPYFHKVLAMPMFYPVKNTDNILAGPFTGAFIVKEKKADRLYLIPDTQGHADRAMATESIVITYGYGSELLAKKFADKDFDIAFSKDTLVELKGQPITAPAVRILWFNSKKEPFDQLEARRTLAGSIDSAQLVRQLKNSEQEIKGIYPSVFRTGEAYPMVSDVEKVDFENGSWRMLVLENESNIIIAEYIKAQFLQKNGVDMMIEYADQELFYQRIRQADFDVALDHWEADIYARYPFFELFRNPLHNPLNASGLIVPEINHLQSELLVATDAQERDQTYAVLEELIIKNAPAVFLSEGIEKEVYIQRIKNVSINPIYVTMRFDNVTY